jgi:hypothetical protein
MSARAAFYDVLVGDSYLNTLGVTEDSVFPNYSNEERPTNSGPFVILRWGTYAGPRWQSENAGRTEQVTVWVHWPQEFGNEFDKLIKIIDRMDDVLRDARDVLGSNDYTMSFVTIGDRSPDLIDDGFNTITKNAAYQVYSAKN